MRTYKMPEPPEGMRWKIAKSFCGLDGYVHVKLQERWLGIWWTLDYGVACLDGTPEQNADNCQYAAEFTLKQFQRKMRMTNKLDVNGLEGAVRGRGIVGSSE
ncbi:hypothetical protein SEA_LOZINAK_109 [Gordonia phage Lozinak]|uniref:Uncharacterized protein n=5 Tax=Smoothievirus TaxID=1982557 RepID=A0A2D1GFW3_9CAUD|nr:hypothetical protein BH768_gp097 [Gordonia phage ClubL]YP_009276222.1 hypothetical protein BH772_gp100 [Gordonia phage Bachita]YP_009281264.1 hypothetical protein BIZ74_gp095 [Gordonia phage Cucurbita]ATN90735.1 hypothetical protein SEA_LOZINAK_109 [Gordonia phage Lozinak]AUE23684.1 hypothetical protein SEA_TONIANN_109 [Gordonia phage Toniann]QAU06975.1 hypothetical protein SEA_APHELION_110 [Gordonia phage Aphelion]QKY79686.1 hypothetical protein SEA_ENGINEER_110 [Gordonia Phage Engineer]